MKTSFRRTLGVLILCVACFIAGLSIPKLRQSVSITNQEKFNAVYKTLTQDWYFANQVDNLDERLMEQSIIGMTTLEEDAHTNYFSIDEAKKFADSLKGSIVGVGFSYYINTDKNVVLTAVYINSPADDAGLKVGDELTQIGNMKCADHDMEDIIQYIQSSEGEKLNVNFLRDEKKKMVQVIPSEFDSTVALEIFDDYAIVELNSFSEQSGEDFAEAVNRIEQAGVTKMILDLRDNTGGYLQAAVDIASSLIPEGSIVLQEKFADDSISKSKTNKKYQQVKMDRILVLQNENTASASEALIGALQDNLGDVVTLMGTTTYGKGTEQMQMPFADGTSLKYTVALWLTPKGKSINEKGFKPDIEVEESLVESVGYYDWKDDDVINADTVNDNAQALQVYLTYLGYTCDRQDAYFSPKSSEQLKEYQEEHDLEATGSCDKKTWDQITKDVLNKMNAEHLDTQLTKAIDILK